MLDLNETRYLCIAFIVGFILLFKPWLHGIDSPGYYAWVRSVVIDGDIDVKSELLRYWENSHRVVESPTGYTYNMYAVGCAVLWLPFFLVGHGLTLLAQGAGWDLAADGYSSLYIWCVSLGSCLYGLAAILLTFQILREHFSKSVSLAALIGVWFSSTLVFYMYSSPLMSHANDTFAFALFALLSKRGLETMNCRRILAMGAAAGLCALIRQQNAILVFPALGLLAWIRMRSSRGLPVKHRVLFIVRDAALFSVAWWAAFSPQVAIWRVVYGKWIVTNPFYLEVELGFHPFQFATFGVLFSTGNGLFTFTPLLLFGVAGLFLGLRRRTVDVNTLLTLAFLLQLYLVSSVTFWATSGPGARYFTNLAPAFALGLGRIIEILRKRFQLSKICVVLACFIAWQLILIVRYSLRDIPRSGSIPLDELLIGQFTAIPKYFFRIIEVLLSRW